MIDFAPNVINNILGSCNDRGIVYAEENSPYKFHLVDNDNDYETLFDHVAESAHRNDTTIAFFLLGKTKQNFRRRLSTYHLASFDLENIRYWELALGCIFTEEFVSIVREYINRWIARSEHHTLHLVFDDFANINLFPLMERERQLISTIANVCKNSVICRGYENNTRGVNLKITFVCFDKTSNTYSKI